MRNYHDYTKEYIGCSDYAALMAVGFCKYSKFGLKSEFINFNGDGRYSAYLVDQEAEIGDHYHLIAEFDHWVKIYDDEAVILKVEADKIKIYRSGDYGCIIQAIDKKDA